MKIEKLRIILLTLLFGAGGVYFIVNSYAAECGDDPGDWEQWCVSLSMVANPPLSAGCGYDIALLGDYSDSMSHTRSDMVIHMKNLVTALKGTNSQFVVSGIGAGSILPFSGDTATVHSRIDSDRFSVETGLFRDLRVINQLDKRPNHQNLIILFTDMFNKLEEYTRPDIVKQSGTRIVIVQYTVSLAFGDPRSADLEERILYLAGPVGKWGEGNITSDMTGQGGMTAYISALAAHAKQPCSPPVQRPGPDPGPGNGGTGDGESIGGTGSGTNGSGKGTDPGNGTGGGSSGATANEQDNEPNSLSSSTGKGDTKEQPELEPSPFFDGKLFAVGSDADTEDVRGVSIAGQKLGLGWVYLAGLLALIAGLLALYFLWWGRMTTEKRAGWKRKLHLKN